MTSLSTGKVYFYNSLTGECTYTHPDDADAADEYSSEDEPMMTMSVDIPGGFSGGEQLEVETPSGEMMLVQLPDEVTAGETIDVEYDPENLWCAPLSPSHPDSQDRHVSPNAICSCLWFLGLF